MNPYLKKKEKVRISYTTVIDMEPNSIFNSSSLESQRLFM